MKNITHPLAECPQTKCLLRLLEDGGRITKTANSISQMSNGLAYYSLEVTIKEQHYYIQGFQNDAISLYNLAKKLLEKGNSQTAK